ncbi:SRPBCC family protein [Saccharopolyspora cebuensis]|uniref:SRPBCC family protein n=1 Tax=Saccharopolyspora cebuensis TaxID=418759 RepID=A0ABV4CQY8_9PSEU
MTATTTASFDLAPEPVLRLERHYPHRRDRVWAALTDPEQLSRWFPCSVEVDLREGGTLTLRFPGEPEPDVAVITELSPPSALAFTWSGEHLRWTLEEDDQGCVLRLTNTIADTDWTANTAAGWTTCFDALAEVLDGRSPAPHTGPDEELIARYRSTLGV